MTIYYDYLLNPPSIHSIDFVFFSFYFLFFISKFLLHHHRHHHRHHHHIRVTSMYKKQNNREKNRETNIYITYEIIIKSPLPPSPHPPFSKQLIPIPPTSPSTTTPNLKPLLLLPPSPLLPLLLRLLQQPLHHATTLQSFLHDIRTNLHDFRRFFPKRHSSSYNFQRSTFFA